MDQTRRACLTAAGVDVDDALERMMGSESLLLRLLRKFPGDPNYRRLRAAVAERDLDGATAASHTLKGVCGNLSLTALHRLFTRQVEALRRGDWAAAEGMMEEIGAAYDAAVDGIGALADDGGV